MGDYDPPMSGKDLTMWKPDICIFHGGCDDGFGAAWAIWKKWGYEVAYVPGVYGKPLPEADGKHILFVDFSAKRPELEAMARVAKSIIIIDHHKTAEADLAPFKITQQEADDFHPETVGRMLDGRWDREQILAWFDLNQSGSVMAWDFAHTIPPNDLYTPNTSPRAPTMLSLIEDRDLWRFAYGDRTKQFSAALRTYPMIFETWDRIAHGTEALVKEGEIVLRAHTANIEKFLADAYEDKVGGHTVPVVNVPYHYASDTAHAMLTKFPDAPFTACWFRRGDGMIQWSLRSEDSRVDVSEIAKGLGGGGHRNAAGFQHPV